MRISEKYCDKADERSCCPGSMDPPLGAASGALFLDLAIAQEYIHPVGVLPEPGGMNGECGPVQKATLVFVQMMSLSPQDATLASSRAAASFHP